MVEFSTTLWKNLWKTYVIGDNGGSYSHLSPQCTDLSSDCIKSSQNPRPLDKTLKCPYNELCEGSKEQ